MRSSCIYNGRFESSCIFHSLLLLTCAFNALTVKTGLGANAIARLHLKEQLGSQLAEIYIMFPSLLSWYAAIRGHSWLSTAGVHGALRPTPSCLALSVSLLPAFFWRKDTGALRLFRADMICCLHSVFQIYACCKSPARYVVGFELY